MTTNPTIERLNAMLALEEKRAALQRELDSIQDQLSTLQSRILDGASAPVSASAQSVVRAKPGRRKRIKRGALSESILAALASAGAAGIRVKDLAAALGAKGTNIHSWFQSTAKRHPVKKLSAGLYRLEGQLAATAPKIAEAVGVKVKAKPGRKKGGSGRRGALAEKIVAALETAGSPGISVKELAEKVGSEYKNVSIWFATTGKKNTKIKKVGPARYKLTA